MVKSILFTKNPMNAESFEDVVAYAEENNCYYTCLVCEGMDLYDVLPGVHILTTKNNDLYILETSYRRNAFDFAKTSSITTPVLIEKLF